MKTLDNINIINSVDAMLEINGVASVSTESKVIDSLEEQDIFGKEFPQINK